MAQINAVPANTPIDRAALGHILFILAFIMATASDSSLFASSIVLALWGSSLVISGGKPNRKKE